MDRHLGLGLKIGQYKSVSLWSTLCGRLSVDVPPPLPAQVIASEKAQ